MMENGTEFLLFLVAVHEIPAELALLSQYATGTGKRRAHEVEERGEGEQFKVFNSAGAGSSVMIYVVIREAPTNTQKHEQGAPLNTPKHTAPGYCDNSGHYSNAVWRINIVKHIAENQMDLSSTVTPLHNSASLSQKPLST